MHSAKVGDTLLLRPVKLYKVGYGEDPVNSLRIIISHISRGPAMLHVACGDNQLRCPRVRDQPLPETYVMLFTGRHSYQRDCHRLVGRHLLC